MLRTTSNSLFKTIPSWRNPVVYSSLKSYTTPDTSIPVIPTEKKQQQNKPVSDFLVRLGGSGRGKAMPDASSDPFAAFLNNATGLNRPNNNNNDRRNGNFSPRPRRQQQASFGQFLDAVQGTGNEPHQPRNNYNDNRSRPQHGKAEGNSETDVVAAAEGENSNDRRQPRTNNNNNTEGGAPRRIYNNNNNKGGAPQNRNYNNNTEGGAPRRNYNNNSSESGAPRRNFNNNNTEGRAPRNNNNRRLNLNRSQQPQEVRTRRATTFIDKDIDWSSFDTTTTIEAINQTQEEVKQDNALLLKDIEGDYDRYLDVGSDIKWSHIVNGSAVGTLVGSNPTLDLSQKTAFLAAVSTATGGNAATTRK